MIEIEIRDLQTKINDLINQGMDFNQLYELSIQLDMLIVKYYNMQGR